MQNQVHLETQSQEIHGEGKQNQHWGMIYSSGQRAFKQSIKVILISNGANLHLRWKMRAPLSAIFSRFSCIGYDEVTSNLLGLAR